MLGATARVDNVPARLRPLAPTILQGVLDRIDAAAATGSAHLIYVYRNTHSEGLT